MGIRKTKGIFTNSKRGKKKNDYKIDIIHFYEGGFSRGPQAPILVEQRDVSGVSMFR